MHVGFLVFKLWVWEAKKFQQLTRKWRDTSRALRSALNRVCNEWPPYKHQHHYKRLQRRHQSFSINLTTHNHNPTNWAKKSSRVVLPQAKEAALTCLTTFAGSKFKSVKDVKLCGVISSTFLQSVPGFHRDVSTRFWNEWPCRRQRKEIRKSQSSSDFRVFSGHFKGFERYSQFVLHLYTSLMGNFSSL